MKKLAQLMTFEEMQERFQKKNDPFELTIEKWGRIRKCLDTTLTLDDFRKLFEAATVAVPFCFEFDVKHCAGCPLGEICGLGEEEKKTQRLNKIDRDGEAVLWDKGCPGDSQARCDQFQNLH